MECPNCKHATSNTALLKCSHCGESFERGELEEYQHLEYLADWLADRSEISFGQKKDLLDVVEKNQAKLLKKLLPHIVPETQKPVETKPAPVIVKPVADVKPAPAILKAETKQIATPAPVVAKPIPASRPKPVVAPKPVAPPKPKQPPVDWGKVITEAATSGALLRAFLYLGAFMIVVSAAVLVIRYWNQFNPILQLVFIAAIPLTFYAGGWLVRTRIKLIQAGTVLTGIGAVLVAVDFAAIYQLGAMGKVNGPAYWLVVTIFCTALYAFTAWRIQGEFFDYLTLLGGTSILFTLTRLLQLPIEWSIVSITLSGVLMTILAGWYAKGDNRKRAIAKAARYLAQILIPTSVFYVMYSPAQPPVGQMSGFLFATAGYAVLAWQFPTIIFAYAALGASIGTVLFGLRVANLSIEWYSTVASILALAYIFIGRGVRRAKLESKIVQNYLIALNTTALLLIVIAVFGGFITTFDKTWAGVTAMTLASLDLAVCAFLFGPSLYTLLSAGLFVVPFTIGVGRWLTDTKISQATGWISVAIAGLAFAYIGVGAVLRKTESHARWLHVIGHVVVGIALFILPFDYLIQTAKWHNVPALTSLGISVAVYLFSFLLYDSGRHSSLNGLLHLLGKAIFLWPLGVLLPIWTAVAWYGTHLPHAWLGTILVSIGLAYIGIGQWLSNRAKVYRLPFHVYVYALCTVGILSAFPKAQADQYPLLIALLLTVVSATTLAYLYNRIAENVIASLLFIWLFQLALTVFKIPAYTQTLFYMIVASLAYIPIAVYLNKFQKSREKLHHIPPFVVGYGLTLYAVIASIVESYTATFIPWIAVAVPLIATSLLIFSASYFKAAKYSSVWAWAGTLTFTIAFGQSLTLFRVPATYDALAWVGLATFYTLFERTLFFTAQKENHAIQKFWSGVFQQAWIIFAVALALFGLFLTLPDTLNAFAGTHLNNYVPVILAQIAVVALAIASARLYQNRWLLFIEPFIAFIPTTLFFIAYGKQIFHHTLSTPQYALIWTALGSIHFITGTLLDRAKVRYSHGLYFGGYIFLSWAMLWSLFDRSTLVWTLGFWILASVTSAALIHFHAHQTWDEFTRLLFGESANLAQITTRNLFQWLAAWSFPIWCVIFLREMQVSNIFAWLGLAVPPLAYLWLARRFRTVDSTYTAPLFSASQFYTVIGLLVSVPTTVEFFGGAYTSIPKNILLPIILLQAVAVLFYIASAWIFQARGFTHIASWLSIIPFTIAWRTYGFAFTYLQFVIPWLIWSTVLLAIGFVLDKSKVRYSHGPYSAGYLLSAYALAVSTTDRITNIYALAITIMLALATHLIIHYGRHHTYEDFIFKYWHKVDETTRQIASTFFLFFASYALPVLLTQILAHIHYPLASRGLILALAAPLYIAVGLFISKAKSISIATIPTWAIYSAGYALTAIGAMVTFGDERLATVVLTLDAIVYAVSAYIFLQAFWLYLATVLTPIIVLLVLHQSQHLESNWVAWIFMALASIYLAIGQIFDRKRKSESTDIHPFAAPFYAPGFLLSAIALAVASSDRMLAMQIYSAGVILYALSAWLFSETLFIYPAAWLATVPYYLAITLTPLELRWYGLAWLPLIIAYIAIGKIFFHKQKLAPVGQGMLVQWLTHSATPFYLLAYALSISMISLSYVNPLAITLAFGIAAILYFASAFLFNKPGWMYASLFTANMTLLTYFAINPRGGEAYYLSIPFHALTWVMALLGFGFSRWITESDSVKGEPYKVSLIERLLGQAWSRPFFVFAITDIFLWQSIALKGFNTTIILGIGHAVLLALFSILWIEGTLVYGVVGFSLLAVGAVLNQAHVPFADAVAVFGGIGFGFYLLARILELISARFKSWNVWLTPLTRSAITLTALAVLINLPLIAQHTTDTAAVLAFAGALYITIAYRGKQYLLGYLGMALLEVAWAIALYMNDIKQPQFYAIPGGLYFMGMAYLELQRNKRQYASAIEILGLGLLLVTAFVQSLNGANGFPYFVLLLVEALSIVWWGTIQKRKIPFFAGISATALNIFAQVVVLVSVYDINRWLVAFGVGLIIMVAAIYIERAREQLRTRVRELSETLEKWE